MPLLERPSDVGNISNANTSPQNNFQNDIEAGLEVGIQNPDGHGPILVPDTPAAYIDHGRWQETIQVARQGDESSLTVSENPGSAESNSTETNSTQQEKPGSMIWGLKRKTFIIVFVIGILLICGIVGGAVGGTLASNKSSPQSSLPSSTTASTSLSPSSSSSPTSSSSLPTQSSSSQPIKPLMSFKLHTFELPNYEGRSQFLYTPGGYVSPYPIRSYTWSPGAPGELDDDRMRCSVALCNDNVPFGWWGRSERRKSNIEPNATVTPPNVLNIECDTDFQEPQCPELSYLSTFVTVPVMETGKPLSDSHNRRADHVLTAMV